MEGGLNEGAVGKIGDFRNLSRHISETVKDRAKVAIDRSPLVPKSMTLSEPWSGFQGHNFQHWRFLAFKLSISQKPLKIGL